MAAELACFDRNVGGGELGQMMMMILVIVMVAVLEFQVLRFLT